MEGSGKGLYISDISWDAPSGGSASFRKVKGIFLAEDPVVLETKNGNLYMNLRLSDRTGRLPAKIWDNVDSAYKIISESPYVSISGELRTYRDMPQIVIDSLSPAASGDIRIEDFLPHTPHSISDMWKELKRIIKGMRTGAPRALLDAIFSDDKVRRAFKHAPAAKNVHHAYIGGLLEHTLSVTRLCKEISAHYGSINREILLTGAILHDIGKIEELSFSKPPIDYTDRGRLIGHIALGMNIIERFMALVPIDSGSCDAQLILHMVLSHHGEREMGSPVVPMTEEAMILHFVDNMDSKINYIQQLKRERPVKEGAPQWTAYQRLLERRFFIHDMQQGDTVANNDVINGGDEGLTGSHDHADDALCGNTLWK